MEIQTFSSLLFLQVSHQDYEIQVSQHLCFPVTETFTMSHGFSWSILGGGMTRDETGRVREYTHKASRLHPSPSHPHIPEKQGGGERPAAPAPPAQHFCAFLSGEKKEKEKLKSPFLFCSHFLFANLFFCPELELLKSLVLGAH